MEWGLAIERHMATREYIHVHKLLKLRIYIFMIMKYVEVAFEIVLGELHTYSINLDSCVNMIICADTSRLGYKN